MGGWLLLLAFVTWSDAFVFTQMGPICYVNNGHIDHMTENHVGRNLVFLLNHQGLIPLQIYLVRISFSRPGFFF